ncbi:ATP-binding protein [Halopiger aswanensis]|uniref:hypothetical protein n=1 Tax=Halopiger aswanensis TaxID=148449 RepID=UPI000E766377|nr:hypothetical protein [Halopiger aswanensis]
MIDFDEYALLGATNRTDSVDEAVKGSHRAQELIEVPQPDVDTRKNLYRYFLEKQDVRSTVDLVCLVEESQCFPAADIKIICEKAAWYAADGH